MKLSEVIKEIENGSKDIFTYGNYILKADKYGDVSCTFGAGGVFSFPTKAEWINATKTHSKNNYKNLKEPKIEDFTFDGARKGEVFVNFTAFQLANLAYEINKTLPKDENVVIMPTVECNASVKYTKGDFISNREFQCEISIKDVLNFIGEINQSIQKTAYIAENEIKQIRKTLDRYRCMVTNYGMKNWELDVEEVDSYLAIEKIEKRFENLQNV